MSPAPTRLATGPAPLRVILLHKAGAMPDELLVRTLEVEMTKRGFAVFVDRQTRLDLSWAEELSRQIKSADAVVGLFSAVSVESEFFTTQVENAHEISQGSGSPHLIMIRVTDVGEIPDPLEGLFSGRPCLDWHGVDDNTRVIGQLADLLREIPKTREPIRFTISKGLRLSPRPVARKRPVRVMLTHSDDTLPRVPEIEASGGAVPLHSEFYVERSADKELQNAFIRNDSIILIKGARQMGKTSMMARGLQFARERGAKVVLSDLQKLNAASLQTVSGFYVTLAETLADQLDLEVLPADTWDERRGPNVNFERFLRREVLGRLNAPLVWGLDEVDRLFTTSFGSEVFGLFRSWHNERALDPSGPWAGMSLVIAYASEAHLFITDMNQSPFNIGTRLTLEDFTLEQVADLNWRYGSPLKDESEVVGLMRTVGGHPFLVRRGLYELATRGLSLAEFESQATQEDAFFGEHLRRILVLLARDPGLSDVVRGILHGQPCPTPESFYRLRSAGLIRGNSESVPELRSQLYARYLAKHLY